MASLHEAAARTAFAPEMEWSLALVSAAEGEWPQPITRCAAGSDRIALKY
jgi:hypothetical protein